MHSFSLLTALQISHAISLAYVRKTNLYKWLQNNGPFKYNLFLLKLKIEN